VSKGHAPIQVREIQGQVTLKRSDAASMKVQVLNGNGYLSEWAGGAAPLKLVRDGIYYVLTPNTSM
jgi:hypothetical protein